MKKSSRASATVKHRGKMKKLQAEMREKIRAANEKRGLLIVHTGDGKGKTTAAFGMLARMLSHKKRCAVIQFIKAGRDPLARLLAGPNLAWHRVGDGFTWDTQDRAADIASCREGWQLALSYLADPKVKFLLLDELNVVFAYDYLPLDEVLEALRNRRPDAHVVVTGRGAHERMIEAADLVTEMREIKHPFHAGVAAQAGIEF
ncbi:MAG: cob(I)yrinic acid a,c-diamide adenosyltransferase [Opitutaceae bacterium]